MFNRHFDIILPHKKSTWTDFGDIYTHIPTRRYAPEFPGVADRFFVPLCTGVVYLCRSLDRGPTEVSLKVNELQKKFQQMREQIDNLPGIDLSRDEQLRQMEVLRQQLAIKTELLRKYKDTERFDIVPS